MRIINKFLTVIFVLLGVFNAFAAETPPNPPATTAKGAAVAAANNTKPPPPDLPIDGPGLLLLVLAAILLGTYVIYCHKLKTKASA